MLKKSKTHRSPTAIRCRYIAGAIEVSKIPDLSDNDDNYKEGEDEMNEDDAGVSILRYFGITMPIKNSYF